MSDIQEQTLTIADIANLKQIVEVATTRGAFQANELSQIGAVYDRVCTWLDMATQSVTEDEETKGDSDA